jgi:hypothetical protein
MQLEIIVRANKNPTSRNQRVGHRRSNALKLSPGYHPRTAAATAGTEDRDRLDLHSLQISLTGS